MADDVEFRPAWQRNDPQIVEDARRLWSLAGVASPMAQGRENELCAAAYFGDELVAVSSANIVDMPAMQNKFFAYRCMVAPHFRQKDMAWKITTYSLKLLQEWVAQNSKERILGLIMHIETDKFTEGLRSPVREKFGVTMHFLRYTPAGQQVRVVWFDGAVLDDSTIGGKP